MKSTVHLDSLHLKVRGVSAATAAAAVRSLGPAIARELAAGTKTPAAGALTVSRQVSASALSSGIAGRVAGSIHSHLRPQP